MQYRKGNRYGALLTAATLLFHTAPSLVAADVTQADAKQCKRLSEELQEADLPAVRRAVADLTQRYPGEYKQGKQWLLKIDQFEKRIPEVSKGLAERNPDAVKEAEALLALRREALLANPLLRAIDRLMVVRTSKPGLPANWQGNSELPRDGYDNEIAAFNPTQPNESIKTIFRPQGRRFVGDVDLHFDADRILFSMPTGAVWQVFEVNIDGSSLRQVTPHLGNDVDSFDACYLPDGAIMFCSTATMIGVPCVGGKNKVASLYRLEPDGNMRQLTFEQDADWCPTVLNSGRVMYLRWEYTDNAHYFSRILMSMNPDGTGQLAHYGSNSYWPNAMFYARPIPDHPSQFVAIVSGHHGVKREGEMIVFDPSRGRKEADGVVQRIPGWGKEVKPVIRDQLVNKSWPRFLHPYPLSDKYFLVSMKAQNSKRWAIYLADAFDNLVLLKEDPKYHLLEPVPLRPTPKPPVIPSRMNPKRKDATVYIQDVYHGGGLEDIPRGTVKSLRLLTYGYAYRGMGGHNALGIECSWDVKYVLGTVPVESDGSASFRVPANMPLSIQPLDEEGRALQLMRSWLVGMPGETVSCMGCHESMNSVPSPKPTLAARQTPHVIEPWYGKPRGFGFEREVQPVLDAHCISCHDGTRPALPDFRGGRKGWSNYSEAYHALHRYVRRPGPESDVHLLPPMEYHTSTSELFQRLRKGHHGVKLDKEGWDRLITWADLNVPYHGTWPEVVGQRANAIGDRARDLRIQFAEVDFDYEHIPETPQYKPDIPPKPKAPVGQKTAPAPVTVDGWPFDAETAGRLQNADGSITRRTIELAKGIQIELVRIPAGTFVMGSANGHTDERPRHAVKIDAPFWMSTTEIPNEAYALFDPDHNSRYADQQWKDHNTAGYPLNRPDQPVVRVSWNEAMQFCQWVGNRTGERVSLPTEAQWEWACRAGTSTPLWFGNENSDFAAQANLADYTTVALAVRGVNPKPNPKASPFEAFLPKVKEVNDKNLVTAPVQSYAPNSWGLLNMHGNVAEWTLSSYQPYPYESDDGRNNPESTEKRVIRGGSWRDRPTRARSSHRLAYEPYQKVFDVGFRVIIPQ